MKKNRGFTLIEVMVVLSILAIIAVLAYGYFGSTMKEAEVKQNVTWAYRGFTQLSQALEMLDAEDPAHPAGSGHSGIGTLAALSSMAYLKAVPLMPANIFDPACGNPWGAGWLVNQGLYNLPGIGTAAPDEWVGLYCVTTDFAKAFNAEYASSLGSTVHDATGSPPFLSPAQEATYCYSQPEGNYCIMYLEIN